MTPADLLDPEKMSALDDKYSEKTYYGREGQRIQRKRREYVPREDDEKGDNSIDL